MKHLPYRTQMWAVLRNGETHMILPDLDTAETYYGLLSHNGFSKHHWTIRKVEVRFPHETAQERRARTSRAVQQVVELNRAIARADQ
jgi:hypothetical protein